MDEDRAMDELILTIEVILSAIILVVFIAIFAYCLKRKKQAEQHLAEYEELLQFKDSVIRKKHEMLRMKTELQERLEASWEVARQLVDIHYERRLGQGAFGSVFLGKVLSSSLPEFEGRTLLQLTALKLSNDLVAVKMLHESADHAAEASFLDEIKIMKQIGHHERLVNLIACVTESKPRLLITEYCANGDLLKHMRQRRQFMCALDAEGTDYSTLADEQRALVVTQKQQMQYAVQIAYGMEYLADRKFVHRDLAARNVLLDANDMCKIGDFGLCRKMEEDHELYLSRGGRLPLKWMSPEALRRYEMSSASDVWSFGVLLFEIVTLGGSPYPDWPPTEILPRLEKGDRMTRPDGCSEQIFKLMMSCWESNPCDRPDFTAVRKECAQALEKLSPDEYYLKLDYNKNYYSVDPENDQPVPEETILMIPD